MAAPFLRGTAFITGAGSGIGRATTLAFARSGIQNLVLTDCNSSSINTLSSEIQSKYPKISIATEELDVTGPTDAVKESILNAAKKFGRIDVAVNVAGIAGNGLRMHESDEGDWMKVLDVNLNGVWRCQRAQLGVMMGQEILTPRLGRGTIINVASMFGIVAPSPSISCTQYAAAKHGVVGLTKGDAMTYASHHIRINAIAPGYILTPLMSDAVESGAMDKEIEKVPMRRLGTPEEVADSITFLASDWASFMNGAVLVVDGGYSAN